MWPRQEENHPGAFWSDVQSLESLDKDEDEEVRRDDNDVPVGQTA
jgi:hypothetical protein